MTPANDNGLGVPPLEYNVRKSFANILRVMRGTGQRDRILNDIEFIAEDTAKSSGDSGKREKARNEIVDGLTSWAMDTPDARGHIEQEMCEAALRLISAKLDRSRTQEAAARSDFWRAIKSAWVDLDEERERRIAGEIEQEVAISMAKFEAFRANDAANNKVISLAAASECYVYFVTDGEAIKIGKAIDPMSRLSGLQTSHHKHLSILAVTPGDERLEREFHILFRSKRLRGEWFEDCADIRLLVDDINSGRYGAPVEAAA